VNPSTALATVVVGALADLGVRRVVLCPGSRSAPLAYAFADAADAGRLELHVRIDERSAGFLALGLAKADQHPVAVVVTSGTAVANLHPAVLEAAHAGVPLLVLSADRPHELRGTGASQTTDQVRLFGPAVRWFAEIPAPTRRPGQVAGWRNLLARAVAAAAGTISADPGPVHLNIGFDDPLVPEPGAGGGEWPEALTGAAGLTAVATPPGPEGVSLPGGPRTVILAGDGARSVAGELAEVGEAAGWPILAEPSSGARLADSIGPYRLLLDEPDLGGAIERVIVYGRPTLSRPVSRLLARPGVEVVVVSRRPAWPDEARRATRVVPAVRPEWSPDDDRVWPAAWTAAGLAASAAIDEVLDAEAAAGRLTGPLVAREVGAATGVGDVLFAGSSNPIRDLDLAAWPIAEGATVLANRGLAGIDGTLSTAAGVALSGVAPGTVRCLAGDLTFLHDVGGLLVGPTERRPDLQIVVVDDGGGGIFGLLEHGRRAELGAAQRQTFERVFATPSGADLAALCAGYGVAHRAVTGVAELRKELANPPAGMSVLQVRVDRHGQRDLAERLAAAVRADAPQPEPHRCRPHDISQAPIKSDHPCGTTLPP
jgi:2-succinyl-5-enolpyruvyl-6-hydroxy-3-cyclohexene-1-carboxylate synthase